MVYSINNEVVFGTAFKVPSYPLPIIKDIFGNDVSMFDAITESDNNRNRDSSITGLCCQLVRNTEIGKQILIMFREYVIIKNKELGISGNGIALLQDFYLIECALLCGMLYESSSLILQMPENVVVTIDIKNKFSKACLSADHVR